MQKQNKTFSVTLRSPSFSAKPKCNKTADSNVLEDVLELELLSAQRSFGSQKGRVQAILPLSPEHFSQSLKA